MYLIIDNDIDVFDNKNKADINNQYMSDEELLAYAYDLWESNGGINNETPEPQTVAEAVNNLRQYYNFTVTAVS